jgi:hypothetical protein
MNEYMVDHEYKVFCTYIKQMYNISELGFAFVKPAECNSKSNYQI